MLEITFVSLAIVASLSGADDLEKARKHLRKAAEHAALFDDEKMLREAQSALAKAPGVGEAYAYMGLFYFRKGDYKSARDHFEACARRDAQFAMAQVYLGNLAYEEGEMEAALDYWSASARLDLTNPEAQASFALGLFVIGQQKEAVQYYVKAMQWDKRYYDKEFLADSKKGAAWSRKKVLEVLPLLALVPKPRFKY
jgi:tetratricopeptide (TPR) repeat protein